MLRILVGNTCSVADLYFATAFSVIVLEGTAGSGAPLQRGVFVGRVTKWVAGPLGDGKTQATDEED
tara:strand:+ start:53 stop:250 length:198 start_codon:yes stop_codon:yes gene_type:complete